MNKKIIFHYIIAALLGGLIVWLLFKPSPPMATPNMGNVTNVIPNPKQYTDAAGTVHTEVKVVKVEKGSEMSAYYQRQIDSMASVLKTKQKYIEELMQANLENSGTFIPVYIDTTGKKSFDPADSTGKIATNQDVYFNDQFLTLKGSLHKDTLWRYSIRETLNIITYYKKKGWFSRELTVDVSSTNPNTRIIGLSGVSIRPKPTKWGIGFFAGTAFDGKKWSPSVGIGIQRNFIRF